LIRWSADRTAKVAIGVQLLILIRLPLECLRLQHVHGGVLLWTTIAPFVHGELITAILTATAVILYFAGKHTLTLMTALLNVATLVVYKLAWM